MKFGGGMHHMGMGKGMMAKGVGFLGGIIKFVFGLFFIIVIGAVVYFMLKRLKEKKEDNIIDAEIIDSYPIKK
jgi:uncharacterized membrane protein YraQ (UPF0718 family)